MSDIIGHNEPIIIIACNSCEHYNSNDFKHFSCKAFLDIPKEILLGDNDHKKPLKGQGNETIYEQIKK